jgi:hypothetical protein
MGPACSPATLGPCANWAAGRNTPAASQQILICSIDPWRRLRGGCPFTGQVTFRWGNIRRLFWVDDSRPWEESCDPSCSFKNQPTPSRWINGEFGQRTMPKFTTIFCPQSANWGACAHYAAFRDLRTRFGAICQNLTASSLFIRFR